jgi:putative transposase
VVDTLGLILAVVVHSAAVQDRDGALAVLAKLLVGFPRLALIWADGGYAGRLVRFLDRWKRSLGWVLQIVKRTDDMKGFVVLPRRWIVERTFGWLGRYRRLSKDYEEQTRNSETMIRLAMINLMLHRLKPG